MPRSQPFHQGKSIGLSDAQLKAVYKMLGPAVQIEGMREESVAQKLALLQLRRLELIGQQENPYKRDFYRFVRECVWTKDEAAGGKVARAPDWPFLSDLADDLVRERLLFMEKSRRVFASWMACSFDVWIAAGGQDPRWLGKRTPEHPDGEPTLLNNDGERQVFIVCRKYEDSVKFLHTRVRFIIDQLFDHGIQELWPSFPAWVWVENEGRASNGSLITAVAQGSDQLRGFAATLIHCEEVAFWERAQQTLESAKPTIQGGGHIVVITTPQAASYAKKIRDGRISGDPEVTPFAHSV